MLKEIKMTANFSSETMQCGGRWRNTLKALKEKQPSTKILQPAKKKALKNREKPRYILKKNENINPHKNVYIAELFIIAKK